MRPGKRNYSPPHYPITHHDKSVLIDLERALKFKDFHNRLCEVLGEDHNLCNITSLWRYAMDLLMAHEGTLLATVDGKSMEFPGMVKQVESEEGK